jgi:hypothetical protein
MDINRLYKSTDACVIADEHRLIMTTAELTELLISVATANHTSPDCAMRQDLLQGLEKHLFFLLTEEEKQDILVHIQH